MKSLAWTLLAAACALPLAAHAQVYKWVDENGKVRYGDTPPPKAKAKVIATPGARSPAAPPAAANAGKANDAKKGPLTPAEQEMEFRKRVKEAQESAAKAEKESKEKEARQQNCESARAALRNYQSGQRIARTNAEGERYFLDDAQVAEEASRAQQAVSQWCQ